MQRKENVDYKKEKEKSKQRERSVSRRGLRAEWNAQHNFNCISCQPFYIDTSKTHLKASNFNSIYIMAQFTTNVFTKPK